MTGYQDAPLWCKAALIGHLTFIIHLDLERAENKFNSNKMEDQIGTVLHWSIQKEPKQAKSKDGVIRRNLDRIYISAATTLPSNPSKNSQVSLTQKKKNQK